MILIVGLGNPGKKYEKARHNIGFVAVDEIAANFQFTIFNLQSIFNAKISKREIMSKKVILAKPQTFMNESGKAVQKTLAYYKIPASNLIVVHDDIDLPLGTIRVSKNSSSGGHKGVQSIIDALGTKNFTRIRIGVKPPLLRQGFGGRAQDFVLENFTKAEEKIIEKIIEKAVEIIKESLETGFKKTTIKII